MLEGKRLVESFSEKHRLRCYILSEMGQYLAANGFRLVSTFDSNSN